MFNGDNNTTKHMYAWRDQYVTKPRLNLSISEGVKYCFHNNFSIIVSINFVLA